MEGDFLFFLTIWGKSEKILYDHIYIYDLFEYIMERDIEFQEISDVMIFLKLKHEIKNKIFILINKTLQVDDYKKTSHKKTRK